LNQYSAMIDAGSPEQLYERRWAVEPAILDRWPASGAEQASAQTHARFIPGNRVDLLLDGDETLPAMFSAIRRARQYVYLEYYVFEEVHCNDQTLSELLIGKSNDGVQIAVIYDAIGSQHTPATFLETLRSAGVRLLPFNPINPLLSRCGWSPNRRDHRKILIADGRLAIVGGINLSTTYERKPLQRLGGAQHHRHGRVHHWRDTDLRLRGPAVGELARLFLDHWAEQGGGPLADTGIHAAAPAMPGQELVAVIGSAPYCDSPRYYHALLSVLRTAESRVWITAGYFLPTPDQKIALIEAAARQVDVRLLLPAHNDSVAALAVQRFTYAELLQAGVKIYEREGVILHSKTVIVDASWSAVGSSNFDQRSVRFNDEVDVVVAGCTTADRLARQFLADTARARIIDLESWRRRPWYQRAAELFCKAWEGLL
jgi:cardiolipin synthase A/B